MGQPRMHVDPIPPREMSVEEWGNLPDHERGELVDGRLVEEEMPDVIHEIVVSWFIGTLRAWLIGRGGRVFGSELRFSVSSRRGRKPDVTAYFPGRPKLPPRGAVAIPPDIAIEVLSPTRQDIRRDRMEKPNEYAQFGIHYYWLVDPQSRLLEFYELRADGLYLRALAAHDGVLSNVPGCPDLTLDLNALWREIDENVTEPDE